MPTEKKLSGLDVGSDFNGTIADDTGPKQHVAEIQTGKTISARLLKREIVLAQKLLTKKQWKRLTEFVFTRPHFFRKANPVDGARETIEKILTNGARFRVFTASGERAFETAIDWCRHKHMLQHPNASMVSVGRDGSKKEVIGSLDAYIGDEVEDVAKLKDAVENLFLIARPYNEDVELPGFIKRVTWEEFYEELKIIKIIKDLATPRT